jgi:hypothetical protein
MKLFGFLKKKDNQDEKAITVRPTTLKVREHIIHKSIEDLIWFKNGQRMNYNPKQRMESNVFFVGDTSYKIEFSYSGSEEPSVIDTKLAITQPRGRSEVDRLPYYPSYEGLSPVQRWVYLKFLSNPYDTSYEIGYTFILYYGLERFLLTDKFESAFEAILKLRDVHENQSFQHYSGNALVLSCLYHQRPDMMVRFIKSIDKDHELVFSDNLFLLSAYSFEVPLKSPDIARLAKTFEFSNKSYISKYPELFYETMTELMNEKFGKDHILLSEILNKKEFNKLKIEELSMFANISISDKKSKVPLISESFKLKKAFYELLEETHESVKARLAELRKKGTAPEPKQKKNTKPKEKIVLVFDAIEEKKLLAELKKNFRNPIDRHFKYIELQVFYYRYRDLDRKYMEKCIEYCEEDIKTLNDVQKSYIAAEVKNLNQLSRVYDKEELESRKREIDRGFIGRIPAFSRLAIIYEKDKEYKKAIEICSAAIQYYNSLNMDTSEFRDRKEKLLNKMRLTQ